MLVPCGRCNKILNSWQKMCPHCGWTLDIAYKWDNIVLLEMGKSSGLLPVWRRGKKGIERYLYPLTHKQRRKWIAMRRNSRE